MLSHTLDNLKSAISYFTGRTQSEKSEKPEKTERTEKTARSPEKKRTRKSKSKSRFFKRKSDETHVKTALDRSEATSTSKTKFTQDTKPLKTTEEKTAMIAPSPARNQRPKPEFKAPQYMEAVEPDSKHKTIAVLKTENADSFHAKNVVKDKKEEKENKEFARPTQQRIVGATDPTYETLRGLNNADTFQNNPASPARPVQVKEKQEFARPKQQKIVGATDANYETLKGLNNAEVFQKEKAEFSRPTQQKIVGATDANYETLRGLSNADAFDAKKVTLDEKEKKPMEVAPAPQKEQKEEDDYENAQALDNEINPKDLEVPQVTKNSVEYPT